MRDEGIDPEEKIFKTISHEEIEKVSNDLGIRAEDIPGIIETMNEQSNIVLAHFPLTPDVVRGWIACELYYSWGGEKDCIENHEQNVTSYAEKESESAS